MQVIEDVRLDLPIGSIQALGIGQAAPLNGVRPYGSFTVDGRAESSGSFDPVPGDWYAAGLGDVQYSTDDLYQLQDFAIPTPVAASSWGRLKRLYR
jgi:hypothetical protein